jgi:hypothetical protein
MSDERYVVVTAVSTHRMRYCVPVSELQKLNTDVDIMNDPVKQIEWANDSVTMEEVKEFSQSHLGEQILDTFILDEERVLQLFDRDNDYLKEWTKEQKLKHIHNWKDEHTWKNK